MCVCVHMKCIIDRRGKQTEELIHRIHVYIYIISRTEEHCNHTWAAFNFHFIRLSLYLHIYIYYICSLLYIYIFSFAVGRSQNSVSCCLGRPQCIFSCTDTVSSVSSTSSHITYKVTNMYTTHYIYIIYICIYEQFYDILLYIILLQQQTTTATMLPSTKNYCIISKLTDSSKRNIRNGNQKLFLLFIEAATMVRDEAEEEIRKKNQSK